MLLRERREGQLARTSHPEPPGLHDCLYTRMQRIHVTISDVDKFQGDGERSICYLKPIHDLAGRFCLHALRTGAALDKSSDQPNWFAYIMLSII